MKGAGAVAETVTFHLRINGGEERTLTVKSGIYRDAAAAAVAMFDVELPAEIEIWVPDLVPAGYGPTTYGAWNDPNYGNLIVGSIVKIKDIPQRQPVVEWL